MESTLKEMSPSGTVAPSSAQSPWIYRPWIDLTVGCGAWSAPLLLLAFYTTATVAIDSNQVNAQLYVAQALDSRGELQAAARHYRAYLQIVAAHRDEHTGEAITVIAALIKVADADAVVKQQAEALKGYEAAIQFAERTKANALGSLALVHLADLQEKTGKNVAATASYQQALAIDASVTDANSSASDWFNYAMFLRRQHQPERLVLACLLLAAELEKATPGPELSTIVQSRPESETRLGREAMNVRHSAANLEKEALSLPASAFSSTH